MKKILIILFAFSIFSSTSHTEEIKAMPPRPPSDVKNNAEIKLDSLLSPENLKLFSEIKVLRVPALRAATVYVKSEENELKYDYPIRKGKQKETYTTLFSEGFQKLGEWLKAGNHPIGAPFAVFTKEVLKDAPDKIAVKIGYPVGNNTKESEQVKIEKLPAQECAVVKYQGDYDQGDEVWQQVYRWITANHYEVAGSPMEIYVKGPSDTKNPAGYLTEIRQPVKREDSKLRQPQARPKPNVKPDMKVSKDVKVGTAK